MTTAFVLGGTDWTAKIGDAALTAASSKGTLRNLKGEETTIQTRSPKTGRILKLTFNYLSASDLATLQALYTAGLVAASFTGVDFASGNYTPVSLDVTHLNSVGNFVYNVILELQLDTAPVVPKPATPAFPTLISEIPSVLGL